MGGDEVNKDFQGNADMLLANVAANTGYPLFCLKMGEDSRESKTF